MTSTGAAESQAIETAADGSGSRSEMISWAAARSFATGVARADRMSPGEWEQVCADFDEVTPVAESLVTEATGLVPSCGAARPVVVDRGGWVAANTVSFEKLLTPLLRNIPPSPAASFPGYAAVARVGRTLSGIEVGALLGWMAGRVLGQYDVILGAVQDGESPSQPDAQSNTKKSEGDSGVLFVAPNIVALERRYGFPSRQFRLWIALHELTHRAQFTGVSWMRGHFLSLVEEAFGSSIPGSAQLADGLKKALESLRSRQSLHSSDIGLLGFFLDDSQRAVFAKVQGLMSLLEGHGDVVMDRAGADLIPLAPHFSRVLASRRARMSGFGKLVMQLVGLDAKMRQYAEGERFVAFVEEAGGPALFARVWESPVNLPDSEEIKEPRKWVERIAG